MPAVYTEERRSSPTGLLTFLYVLFGCIGLVVFLVLLVDPYVVNDTSYLFWRDAKVELLARGASGAATRWRAILVLVFLAGAAACFAVVVDLRSSIRRRSLVVGSLVAVAVVFLVALILSPTSPYRH